LHFTIMHSGIPIDPAEHKLLIHHVAAAGVRSRVALALLDGGSSTGLTKISQRFPPPLRRGFSVTAKRVRTLTRCRRFTNVLQEFRGPARRLCAPAP
jgi:hypothetical protein